MTQPMMTEEVINRVKILQEEIDQLLVFNPGKAYEVKIRKGQS